MVNPLLMVQAIDFFYDFHIFQAMINGESLISSCS